MMTSLDCMPCLLRQMIESSGLASPDDTSRERIIRDILKVMAHADFSQSPPALAREFHSMMKNITGIDDPYRDLKKSFNSLALSMLASLTEEINRSQDPLKDAIRLSISGNIIDSGAKSGLNETEVRSLIDGCLNEYLSGDIDLLIQSIAAAKYILFIADNAGEIVFDRLLIEKIGPARVTVGVRGFPIINDATIDDARSAGIDKISAIIENGSDAPGTILETCSDEFKKCFEEADLVIAKGQGNYETLCDESKNIFFLLKVKCPIIADHTGYPVGSHAIIKSMMDNTVKTTATVDTPKSKIGPFTCVPIGIIHSEHVVPSKTPIQPIYAGGCRGSIEIFPEYAEGLKDLEGFSHIYIIFQLHKAGLPKLIVKPFLEDVERGVFATRAPARPNPIGMSIVELLHIEGNIMYLDCLDILDGTPVIDIKPYTSRFDRIDTTRNGWHDSVDEKDAKARGVRGYKK